MDDENILFATGYLILKTKDLKEKRTRSSKGKKNIGSRDLQRKELKWNLPQYSSRHGSRRYRTIFHVWITFIFIL